MPFDVGPNPQCTCVADMNADPELIARNTQVTTLMFTDAVVLATRKHDEKKRGRPIYAIASYCPFCGVKYQKSLKIGDAGKGGATQPEPAHG